MLDQTFACFAPPRLGIVAEDNEEVLVANSWSSKQVKQATDEEVLSCARRLAEKKVLYPNQILSYDSRQCV